MRARQGPALAAVAFALAFFVDAAVAIGQTLTFTRRLFLDAPHTSSLVDLDGDGRYEVVGLSNLGTRFTSRTPAAMGLAAAFAPMSYVRNVPTPYAFMRYYRHTLAADVDNDGRPDLVNNVYWCNADPENTTQLYRQNADGTFRRDLAFEARTPVRGWGETIVAADFDNDGFLDLYIPQYTRPDGYSDSAAFCGRFLAANAPGRSWLLMNGGAANPGTFRAVASTPVSLTVADCGADCVNSGSLAEPYVQPEGAQAVDFDEDGNIDLVVAGSVFRNLGAAQFVRTFPAAGVVPPFDEGLKFIDWNNDGYPDFVYVDPYSGVVHLLTWKGGMRDASGRIVAGQFVEVVDPAIVGAFRTSAAIGTYGLTAGDLNGDGYDDVVLNGGVLDLRPKVFLNAGPPTYAFSAATLVGVVGAAGVRSGRDGLQIGDINGDGRPDLVIPGAFGNRSTAVYFNTTVPPAPLRLEIEVLGEYGGHAVQNQQGRVVHVAPSDAPGFIYTRYVDGGSGYLSQGPYPVTVHTHDAGPHTISVRLADGWITCAATPPAYVVILQHADPPCAVEPLPTAYPVPSGHEYRAIAPALTLVVGDESPPSATPCAKQPLDPAARGPSDCRPAPSR